MTISLFKHHYSYAGHVMVTPETHLKWKDYLSGGHVGGSMIIASVIYLGTERRDVNLEDIQ